MRYLTTNWVGRTKDIDPTSLVEGDEVDVCYCDTGATCVWSFPAIVRKDEAGQLRLADSRELTDDKAPLLRDVEVGCYTYLSEPFKRA